jgi:hypothetical protein
MNLTGRGKPYALPSSARRASWCPKRRGALRGARHAGVTCGRFNAADETVFQFELAALVALAHRPRCTGADDPTTYVDGHRACCLGANDRSAVSREDSRAHRLRHRDLSARAQRGGCHRGAHDRAPSAAGMEDRSGAPTPAARDTARHPRRVAHARPGAADVSRPARGPGQQRTADCALGAPAADRRARGHRGSARAGGGPGGTSPCAAGDLRLPHQLPLVHPSLRHAMGAAAGVRLPAPLP